ncbi:acyltransferase family protein [Tsukamurella soli]|uniref:Acyltransferase n=1 Tax=Tsukamurella soli TaxID=644556 RepID=A0ABP8KF29_9ACTN
MKQRVASLTGLRAVAAAAVCATHAAFSTGRYTDDFAGHSWARLEVGVPLFFALSGYLLFRPWVAVLTSGSDRQPALRRYAWHRFRRVLPAYWLVVTLVYLIGLVRQESNPSGHGFVGYLRHLPLIQIYEFGYMRVGLTQTWSLCVEVAFYVVLPLIGWFLTVLVCRYRWRPARLLVALAVLAVVSPAWDAIAPHVPNITARMWPPAYLWWFLGGMALTVAEPLVRAWPRWATPSCLVAAMAAYLAACLAVAGPPTMIPQNVGQAVLKSALYVVFAVAVIAPLALPPAAARRGWYDRLLASRPLVWLGGISYEFFLVHLMVMEILLTNVLHWHVFTGNVVLAFVYTSVVTVPLAWALRRITAFGENGPGTPAIRGERREVTHERGAHRRSDSQVV